MFLFCKKILIIGRSPARSPSHLSEECWDVLNHAPDNAVEWIRNHPFVTQTYEGDGGVRCMRQFGGTAPDHPRNSKEKAELAKLLGRKGFSGGWTGATCSRYE